MTDTHFEREMLSRLRAISNNCIDLWAVGRLRIMANEIEQRIVIAENEGETNVRSRLAAQRLGAQAFLRSIRLIALKSFGT